MSQSVRTVDPETLPEIMYLIGIVPKGEPDRRILTNMKAAGRTCHFVFTNFEAAEFCATQLNRNSRLRDAETGFIAKFGAIRMERRDFAKAAEWEKGTKLLAINPSLRDCATRAKLIDVRELVKHWSAE